MTGKIKDARAADAMDTTTVEIVTSERRQDRRRRVRLPALLHTSRDCQLIMITELSVGDTSVEVATGVRPGDEVEIELQNGRRFSGRVVWCIMGACGIGLTTRLADDDLLLS